MREYFLLALGFCGSYVAAALGGWDSGIQTLVAFMGVDFISGIILAGVFKRSKKGPYGGLSSICSFKGLFKKGMMLIIVFVGHQLDLYMGFGFVRTAVIIAFIANELISIVENAGLMGIPIPAAIRKAVDVLNQDSNKGTSRGDSNGI